MTYISGIERGLRNPSLNNIRAIAKAMDVNTAELFSFESECSFDSVKHSCEVGLDHGLDVIPMTACPQPLILNLDRFP